MVFYTLGVQPYTIESELHEFEYRKIYIFNFNSDSLFESHPED